MNYVVDKNTNRLIYAAEEGRPYLLDPHTYLFVGPPMFFEHALWRYRVEGGTTIVLAPVKQPLSAAGVKTAVNSTPSKA